MAADKIARRHHILPEFYLKRFADTAEVLTQVWLPGDKSHPVSVSDASVITDFYNVQGDDGELNDLWEKHFASRETVSANAFAEVVDAGAWPPSPVSRWALAEWTAMQLLRTSAIRNHLADSDALIIRLQTGTAGIEHLRSTMEAGLGRPVLDDELEAEWDDLTQPGGTRLATPAEHHLAALLNFIVPTMHMLHDMTWCIVRFDRKRLVTSDSPVCMQKSPDAPAWEGVGFATAGSFTVSLSRFVGLFIKAEPMNAGSVELPASTAFAQLFNAAAIGNARRWFIHHPDDGDMVDPKELHEPVDREVSDGGGDGFISREGLGKAFRESGAPSLPDLGGGDSIPHYTWPIPNRVFENPFAPPSNGIQ